MTSIGEQVGNREFSFEHGVGMGTICGDGMGMGTTLSKIGWEWVGFIWGQVGMVTCQLTQHPLLLHCLSKRKCTAVGAAELKQWQHVSPFPVLSGY